MYVATTLTRPSPSVIFNQFDDIPRFHNSFYSDPSTNELLAHKGASLAP